MWHSVISLENGLSAYRGFIEERLKKVGDLSFVSETGKSRTLYHLAASDYEAQNVAKQVIYIVADVLLVKFKLDYILSKLSLDEITLPIGALLSCLLYFDSGYEKKVLVNELREEREYSIDGIMNFRLSELKRNWDELASLTESLLDLKCGDKEIFNLISFITGGGRQPKQTLLIADDGDGTVITNVTRGAVVDVFPVFGARELDTVNAVISQNPTEVIIEGGNCERSVSELFKNFLKVKFY